MGAIKSRMKSFGFAGRGLRVLFGQPNTRIHLCVAICVIILGVVLKIHTSDWAIIALCITIVLSIEAMNTAVERVVDLASPKWHALAKDAKDLAAGAVLIAAAGSAIIGILVFAPYLLG